jgi:hypothetical protein
MAIGSLLLPVFTSAAPPPSFTSKVSVSPAAAKAGKAASVAISLSDKSKPVTGGTVDLEVYNAHGKKVGQQVWSGQSLSGAKNSVYHWSWKPAAPGTYTLKLGVFSNGWKTLDYWADKAIIVKVS